MALVSFLLGSIVGLFSAMVSLLVFDASFATAFGIYLGGGMTLALCSIAVIFLRGPQTVEQKAQVLELRRQPAHST